MTREDLTRDLRRLGLSIGDTVMVHASVRRIGPIDGGVETLVRALLEAVGESGTLVAYVDWEIGDADPDDADPPIFDKRSSRAARANGILAETIRTWPGAIRSDNPDAGIAAIGACAAALCADHPLSYGYGETSPFAKLVADGAKVLVLGAPLDTITLLHHAEHLARIEGKRVIGYRRAIRDGDSISTFDVEEFDTSDPIVDGMPADAFADIARIAIASGAGRSGVVGLAQAHLIDAGTLVREGIGWFESWSPPAQN